MKILEFYFTQGFFYFICVFFLKLALKYYSLQSRFSSSDALSTKGKIFLEDLNQVLESSISFIILKSFYSSF